VVIESAPLALASRRREFCHPNACALNSQ